VAGDEELVPTMTCPRCGEELPDMDGFGCLAHLECGYCTHPSVTDGVCGICATHILDARAERASVRDRASHRRARSAMIPVLQERMRQVMLWGHDGHQDGTGFGDGEGPAMHVPPMRMMRRLWDWAEHNDRITFAWILLEEVVEVMHETDPVKLRGELVQVAAVCVRWIEDLDRRIARRCLPV